MSGEPIDTGPWPKYGPDQTTFSHRPPSETNGTALDNKTRGSLDNWSWVDPETRGDYDFTLGGKYSSLWSTGTGTNKISGSIDAMGAAIFNALDDIRVTLDRIACDVRVFKIRGCEEPIGIVTRHCCPNDSYRKSLQDMADANNPPMARP